MKMVTLFFTLLLSGFCQGLPLPGPGMPASGGASGGHCTPVSGYSHCRVLTIDHTQVGGNALSNFPVLVSMTLGSSRLQSPNCYDVVFTSDSGGTNRVPWEQETCGQATGTIVDWVSVASISSSVDTVIYVSYDNPGISSAQNTGPFAPVNVWTTFTSVFHFPNGTNALSVADSTGANNGTVVGSGTTYGTGVIDGAATFNSGLGGYLTAGNSLLNVPANGTVSFWVYPTANGQSSGPVYGNTGILGKDTTYLSIEQTPANKIRVFYYSGSLQYYDSITSVPLNAWTLVSVGWNPGGSAIYLNGTFDVSSSLTFANVDSGNTGTILQMGVCGSCFPFAGLLDEYRFSPVREAPGWVTAEYNNQKLSSTFVTIGVEI